MAAETWEFTIHKAAFGPTKRMHYDLTDLRLFLNVGETENLTRAAERSFLSLPAASTRIKQLEEAFQTQLLIRRVKGVRLTPRARRCCAMRAKYSASSNARIRT